MLFLYHKHQKDNNKNTIKIGGIYIGIFHSVVFVIENVAHNADHETKSLCIMEEKLLVL